MVIFGMLVSFCFKTPEPGHQANCVYGECDLESKTEFSFISSTDIPKSSLSLFELQVAPLNAGGTEADRMDLLPHQPRQPLGISNHNSRNNGFVTRSVTSL